MTGFIKKFLLTVSVMVFLLSSGVFAYEKGKFYFAFSAGYGLSFPNGEALSGNQFSSFKTNGSATDLWDDPIFSLKPNFNASIKTTYVLTDEIRLLFGFGYDSKKFQIIYPKNGSSEDYHYEFSAQFANLYLGARYSLAPWFSLGGGGFYGFLLNNIEMKEEYSSGSQSVSKTTIIDKDLIHDNIGAYLETSFILYSGQSASSLRHIEAGLRFEKGFSKIYKDNSTGVRYLYTNSLLGFIEIVFGL